jgi:RNA polymerase-binding transcription factor DksA
MGVSGHYRTLLERELAESRKAQAGLTMDIVSTSDLRRGSNVDDEHDPEGSTIAFELSQSATLLRDADARITEVQEALRRLDEGRYGSCEVCGRPISEGRLEARPWTRFCIEHTGGR